MKPINILLFLSAIIVAFVSVNLVELGRSTHSCIQLQTEYDAVYYITFTAGVALGIMAVILFIASTGKIYFEVGNLLEDDSNNTNENR